MIRMPMCEARHESGGPVFSSCPALLLVVDSGADNIVSWASRKGCSQGGSLCSPGSLRS